ncbi:MAG: cation transporter [Candidatus Nanopelagicales bacterium]|nr:cation transporter [Candidatus Nanopelagicales bacterium]
MSSSTYAVQGMTCAHCVSAVIEEVTKIDGVTEVYVDLHAGELSQVHITSAIEIGNADINSAIVEAGYTLVSA